MNVTWDDVLNSIKGKISKPSYETWFVQTSGEFSGNALTIEAANSFSCDWLANHYQQLISEVVQQLTGESYNLVFISPHKNTVYQSTVNTSNATNKSFTLGDILNLITSQNTLIQSQQQQINELEKRLLILEEHLKATLDKT